VLVTLGVYANVNNPVASTKGDYAITTSSGASEIALAQHLNKVGARCMEPLPVLTAKIRSIYSVRRQPVSLITLSVTPKEKRSP